MTYHNNPALDAECTLDARTEIWRSVDGRIYNGTIPLTDRQALEHLLFHCRACDRQPKCVREIHAYQEFGREPDYSGWKAPREPNPKMSSQRGKNKKVRASCI